MRGERKLRGRLSWTTGLLGLAGAFGLALVLWPDAFATDEAVVALKQVVETQPGRHRKLMALKELTDIDSRDSRAAVIELASSADEATALAAISAMSRSCFSGACDALEDIAEDGDRTDGVRCAALAAWMEFKKREDDAHWSDVSSWVAARAGSTGERHEFADAYARHVWGSEVSGE